MKSFKGGGVSYRDVENARLYTILHRIKFSIHDLLTITVFADYRRPLLYN